MGEQKLNPDRSIAPLKNHRGDRQTLLRNKAILRIISCHSQSQNQAQVFVECNRFSRVLPVPLYQPRRNGTTAWGGAKRRQQLFLFLSRTQSHLLLFGSLPARYKSHCVPHICSRPGSNPSICIRTFFPRVRACYGCILLSILLIVDKRYQTIHFWLSCHF